ncbi:MAG: hypothetical protein A2Y10_19305 [Planctomycetes bacterium GWF2_41_51]|nr:MAG: hypothetical protein A2Y10_19305 [Planctomycetes bacterium GWF2_41_51]HBG25949.1 oxidoreductase [Phycisphaerales bacterium]
MNILEQVHTGKRSMPPRLMVYGVEGVGKSTFGANAPNPIFIPTEDGLSEIDCASFPVAKKYADVEAYLSALAIEKHDYQTVIVDSCDWLEQLIWEELCRLSGASTIEKCDGGYGKGYIAALGFWHQIVDGLDALRNERHMAVILIAHAKVERFEDPESNAYDRYTPRLHKHATALLTEWADAVLFATRKFRTESEKMGFGKERTIAVGLGKDGGERVIRTVGGPSCIAKNRYDLPYEIPLSWDAFISALNNSNQPQTTGELNNG